VNVTKINAVLGEYVLPFLGICAWLVFSLWFASFLARLLYNALARKVGADTARAVSKTVKYLLVVLFTVSLIRGAGVDVSAVLGAAGVAGVAVGFASQTSLSNLISGLFLVLERPFKVGDWIEVDGSSGFVHSVELLSSYIRTFDNRMVRIPNEMLAKSKLINHTHYPIRRLDLTICVSCREDAARVMRIFREVVIANPLCFNEPEPMIVLQGFGDSSMEFLVAVWTERGELRTTRTSLLRDIKERFDREGIALPYHRIRMAECDGAGAPEENGKGAA